MPLLDVENLSTEFRTEEGVVHAADNITLQVEQGETLGIVGESGSGKSVTARSIMRLVDSPGRISNGEIQFKGEGLRKKSEDEMERIRGKDIGMIFQDALESLNPVLTIGDQVAESIRAHNLIKDEEITWSERSLVGNFLPRRSAETRFPEAWEDTVELMESVGIPEPEQRAREYPHQFSGGMRQRAMIAMAIACRPDLLIADEPTTALDVTIQAQILNLLQGLQDEIEMGILLITHDIGVVIETCDRVAVMYAGEIVETGSVEEVFKNPQHPYTSGLIQSIPEIKGERKRLNPVSGQVPDLIDMPDACYYAPRCEYAHEACYQGRPHMYDLEGSSTHEARCVLHETKEPGGLLELTESEPQELGEQGVSND